MASIKDLRKRITSTKNTQQTTKAMKMVSAAKLRRSTEAILSQRPYANEMVQMMKILSDLGAKQDTTASSETVPTSLCVVFSSDRGLCGGYNSNVIKAALSYLNKKSLEGKTVKFIFVGKKINEAMRSRAKVDIFHYEEFGPKANFKQASELAKKIKVPFENQEVDEIIFIYNKFVNAISQVVTTETVLPLQNDEQPTEAVQEKATTEQALADLTIFEPNKTTLYEQLASKYFVVQVFKALLEAQASEHGARMSAMESATKNAGDMIKKLTIQYNKQRQAGITKELLEIISGSESQKTN